ncbi:MULTISPECIES: cation diffusion facilitator family transporter [Burkholderia]|jgi:cobalt-zinc-cadmium efflux system protein|uniref:Cation diffusion facilitator family transporter n=2 Tax=Burkholderia contaminans TaxID=488447 RepID=A0A1E3FT12_9BURK|nr:MULTISPECIES: cation diffusion facilitator family transporter [Burkholderia]UTP25610.1 cation diffusion facilitator family transporter [Burkholderia sp. FXe9]KKL41588.1 cation transporter [Burkholderia contaminans LMG 23361]MBA9827875.1 cation diffusion facilitator family transporter [Burkholderia contaminans]MBA9836114.1 cation diffusion facilitator family transporter [Burkholderia contaminans]MBA9860619.1 cation diffusion facilitator family transporter [Burkholderia contaminans]
MQRTSRATSHVYAATSRALAVSLAINLLLLAVETVAAWSAHSSGLLADVAHAAIDLAADALILVACRLDARLPPERRPTYEPLALAGLGALLVVTGAQMIRHATNGFATPPVVQPGATTLALVAVTLAGKATLSHWMLRKARETGSALLEASGWHVRTDALSSLLAALAMSAALVGFGRLDDLAALAIGALVIRTGVGFIRRGCAQWPALAAWADRSTRGS